MQNFNMDKINLQDLNTKTTKPPIAGGFFCWFCEIYRITTTRQADSHRLLNYLPPEME